MATTYASYATKAFNSTPSSKAGAEGFGGQLRVLSDVVTYASQASGDIIVVGGGKLPVGAKVLYGALTTSTSTSTATLSVGISGTATKYKTAAAVTTTDVPQLFGVVSGKSAVLTAEEQIILTVGTAALPASGTLLVEIFYTI